MTNRMLSGGVERGCKEVDGNLAQLLLMTITICDER